MAKLQPITLLRSAQQERTIIETAIRKQATYHGAVRVLEAGCGRHWPFQLNDVNLSITGVDSDSDAIAARQDRHDDLTRSIVSSLFDVTFPPNSFDVVYCSFVLEHVEDAETLMRRFVRWLAPGGIIILRVPDPFSVYGFIAKYTPHWFHVSYYRYVLGKKQAGANGHGPYPTHYSALLSRHGMQDFCQRYCVDVSLTAEYAEGFRQHGKGWKAYVVQCVKRVVSWVSLGRLSYRHSNLTYILQRNGPLRY
ncbi:class I SAM-dependent methyltransferase [Alteromonas oceanisediminis]|uniref:class I SAM-dependent methyltransferase n=1 Tax=Alteromonas oceanisediminis TaxID=2836180 RepID=UPI001BD97D5E|nr:class I SAM-dependent methyltransferase [Alteromonas oceanisediminis]MBT0585535.1 methyltransferase domain-containing protein [Alteromonas oceanisediminis]